MKNINAYNQQQFQHEFEKTKTFRKLNEDYRHVFFDKFLESKYKILHTPRHRLSLGWVTATSWHYLNKLDPDVEMFDLGCGMNFFKPYFPNVIGIGAEDNPNQFFGDIHDFVDTDFFQGHINAYKSVFSINALHFRPLENLRNLCINFSQMIKPGGKGYLALNTARMYDQSLKQSLTLKHLAASDIEPWIRDQFNDFPCDIEVFDVDLSEYDAWLDGNIRIVFKK
jgi:hypothetical protein